VHNQDPTQIDSYGQAACGRRRALDCRKPARSLRFVSVAPVFSVWRLRYLRSLLIYNQPMALQLDEQLRRHDDLARRAKDLRSYL
jgi:hypothetical protein